MWKSVPISLINLLWEHENSECDNAENATVEDLQEVGNPICVECGELFTLASNALVKI